MNDAQRLAVCSWSLQPTSCDDLIEKVRACGLSAVQLHLDPLAEHRPGWEGAAEALRAAGIRATSGMVMCVGEDYSSIARIEETGGVVPDATWPETKARMEACAPVAAELGLPLVTFHAGFIPDDAGHPVRAKVRERIDELAHLFARHRIGLGLETGQEASGTLLGFLSELRGGNVGVNFDPANMLLYGSGDPIEALRRLSPYVRQVHLKDAVASGTKGEWGREVPIGDGEVDWPAFFRILDDTGYAGPLPIEREAGDSRIDDIRRGVEHLRASGFVK